MKKSNHEIEITISFKRVKNKQLPPPHQFYNYKAARMAIQVSTMIEEAQTMGDLQNFVDICTGRDGHIHTFWLINSGYIHIEVISS